MKRRIFAAYDDCYICYRPVDKNLRWPNPWSGVVDETIPIARGGTLTFNNSGLAHAWCNRIKGTHSLEWARHEVRQRLNSTNTNLDTLIKPTSRKFTTSEW
jgi:hypothetical protein